MGLVWYLLGVISGIVGLFVWAMIQASGKQSKAEEAVEEALKSKE